MNKLTKSRLSLLATYARHQRIGNWILTLSLALSMRIIQVATDSNAIYWIAGITLPLLWWGMSNYAEGAQQKDSFIVIRNGEIVTGYAKNYIKLIQVYIAVIKTLKIDSSKYSLQVNTKKIQNAFAAGLKNSKTVCVYQSVIDDSTVEELAAVIAHEFGHTINRDLIFSVFRGSLGCSISLIAGGLGSLVVWYNQGWETALLLLILASVIIPAVSAYSSRCTENFADAYATVYGFGPGLASFLNKIHQSKPDQQYGIKSTHPHPHKRIISIDKVNRGDEGLVADRIERALWDLFTFSTVGALSAYTYSTEGLASFVTVLTIGCLFLGADNTLDGNLGLLQARMKLSTEKPSFGSCLSGIITLVVMTGLYLGGAYAAYAFNPEITTNFEAIVKVTLVLWTIKPLTASLGAYGNDGAQLLSELGSYTAMTVSLIMLIIHFVPSMQFAF